MVFRNNGESAGKETEHEMQTVVIRRFAGMAQRRS